MKTIFVVDDNSSNLVAAAQALAGTYKVLTIPSAERMFKLLEKLTPEMILLDIDMPEMDGFDALAKLKNFEKWRDIPVIFLTATIDPDVEVKGFALGAVDYINKPFSAPVLLKRLETHLNLDEIVKQRTAEVEILRNGIITVLAEVIEERDKVTGGHIRRTQKYLEILLNAMKERGIYSEITDKWNFSLVLPSAQLHDVGKIIISDLILNKTDKLTSDEFETIKYHSAEGEKLVDKIALEIGENNDTFLYHAKLFAGTHHEKWNGKGYPMGLSRHSIPLEGRIMAIADVYDALTSERPYKKAFSHEESVEIIKKDSGAAFDPVLVEVFLEVAEDFWVAGMLR